MHKVKNDEVHSQRCGPRRGPRFPFLLIILVSIVLFGGMIGRFGDTVGRVGSEFGDTVGAMGDTVGAMGDRFGDTVGAMGDTVGAMGDRFGDTVGAMGDRFGDAVSAAVGEPTKRDFNAKASVLLLSVGAFFIYRASRNQTPKAKNDDTLV